MDDRRVSLEDGNVIEQEIGRIMRVDYDNKDKKAVWFDYVDYDSGIFRNQYYTRRKVYKRLNLEMKGTPDKKVNEDLIEEFLNKNEFYF